MDDPQYTRTRPEVVDRLVDAASAGMATVAEGTTANEVFSAGFTMASRMITVALAMGANPEALRDAVTKLWEKLPKQVVQ